MTSTEEGPGGGGGWRFQPFASFRERGYPWLWASSLSYGAAQSAQGFAIAWLVIEKLDRDYPSALLAALAIPTLLLALPAGRVADRGDRRLLLMASHLAVALGLLLSAILIAADVLSLGLVILVAVLTASGRVGARGARTARAHSRARAQERILNANALDSLGLLLGGGIVGGLQAVILRYWAIEVAFLLQAIVVATGALFLMPLRVPPREPAADNGEATEKPAKPATMRSDIAEGFRFLWGTVELRMLFVLLLTATLVGPWLAYQLTGDRLDLPLRAQLLLTSPRWRRTRSSPPCVLTIDPEGAERRALVRTRDHRVRPPGDGGMAFLELRSDSVLHEPLRAGPGLPRAHLPDDGPVAHANPDHGAGDGHLPHADGGRGTADLADRPRGAGAAR